MNDNIDTSDLKKKSQFAKNLKARLQNLVKTSHVLVKDNELQRLEKEKQEADRRKQEKEQQEIERQLYAQEEQKKIKDVEQQIAQQRAEARENKRRIDLVKEKHFDRTCANLFCFLSVVLLILSAISFLIGFYHFVAFTHYNRETNTIEVVQKDAELRQAERDRGLLGVIFGDSKVDRIASEIANIWDWITIPMWLSFFSLFICLVLYGLSRSIKVDK